MPDNSARGGGDSASSTLEQQVTGDLFGDDGTADDQSAAADGGRDESEGSDRPATDEQARDRTATSVFGDLKQEETDDVDAVFDHYDVDSTEEVLSAEGSGTDPEWSTDPIVIGEDDGGFGDLLLDDRDEGEEFNWVAADEAAGSPSTAGEAGSDATAEDRSGRRPDDEGGPTSGLADEGESASRPDGDRDGDATGSGWLDAAPGTGGEPARDDGAQTASADESGSDASVADEGGVEAEADDSDAGDAADDEQPGLLRRIVRRITSLF